MKQSEAMQHIELIRRAVQRLRSVTAENGLIAGSSNTLGMTEEQAARVWSWVWGKKCVLPALSKIEDNFDESGILPPQSYYNVMYIATQLEPMIGVVAGIIADIEGKDFPFGVDISVMRGWEPEE